MTTAEIACLLLLGYPEGSIHPRSCEVVAADQLGADALQRAIHVGVKDFLVIARGGRGWPCGEEECRKNGSDDRDSALVQGGLLGCGNGDGRAPAPDEGQRNRVPSRFPEFESCRTRPLRQGPSVTARSEVP